ncbi:unnamed protein product [Polarella glacialis]|nr:unnamed protein product [Polarella glacialis]
MGRCLFAATDIAKGETLLTEAPLFVSRPEAEPAILSLLERLHKEAPLGLGHTKAHYAAVLSHLFASPAAYEVLVERWAPKQDGRLSLEEMERVWAELEKEGLLCHRGELPEGRAQENLTPSTLQKLVTAWEFNGFSGESNELLMYDKISTASHSCDPNCDVVILYGLFRSGADKDSMLESTGATGALKKGDKFEQRYAGLAFRANRALKRDEEISFSYCLTAEDLAQDFQFRRAQLNLRGWKFVCNCERCTAEVHEFLTQGKEAGPTEPVDAAPEEMCGLFDDL